MKLLKIIKPKSGVNVTHENGAPLSPEGEAVIWSTWWQRRQNDGDVIIQRPRKTKKLNDKKETKS